MPRTGKHPLKMTQTAPDDSRRAITVCTVIHIPMLEGYWQDSLAVLKLFFESLYASTDQPFDLMVFDNASCAEAQNYLLEQQRAGRIQFLHQSTYNLKKLGAMNYLFSCASGEYVSFVDSDVYLLPGWLEASLEILKTFPEAGQVSAIPTIDKRQHFLEQTLQGVQANKELLVERGNDLMPDAYIEAHRISIGRERAEYMKLADPREDVRITRNGVSAYLSAQDFQFTTRREIIRKVLPLEVRSAEEYYDPIYSPVFEAKINELGYWRLSTEKYLVHHMGNHLPDIQTELAGSITVDEINEPSPHPAPQKRVAGFRGRILKSRPVRNLLKRIYTLAYSLLFEETR